MNGLMNVHMDIQGDVACTETYLFAYHKICAKKAQMDIRIRRYGDVRSLAP
jgi:hypothetical protein